MTFARPQSGAAATDSIAADPPVAGCRVEPRGPHRDDDDRVLGLNGGERAAGVDRAHEGVRRLDGDDLRHLRDVEHRRNPGRDVLAEAGCRRQHMRIAARLRECDHRRRDVLRHRRGQVWRVGVQHLGDPRDRRGGLRCGSGIPAGDQHVDVAADLLCGGNGIKCRRLDRRVVVVGKDQDGHLGSGCSQRVCKSGITRMARIRPGRRSRGDGWSPGSRCGRARRSAGCQMTLASPRSLATSSLTSATLPPPWRFGGSTTLSVAIRGVTSTPSVAGFVVSSGFFFAFMMFGSVA